jgi:hypothetical protein
MSASDDGARTGRAMVEAFLAGDAAGMVELLAPSATFHSPVADYAGRERVAEVLRALVKVVTDARLVRLLETGDATAACFSGAVDGRVADGVLVVVARSDGRVAELTLMVRPLRSLLAGIERMKALLAAG